MTSIYRMSEAGACPTVLAAMQLGYEPVPESEASLRLMRHASRHEELFADDLYSEYGWVLDGGIRPCPKCTVEFDSERYGIHIEIRTQLIRLIGHLDRRAIIIGVKYPVEIKSLGRFTFDKFKRDKFDSFPEYAAQETCYLEAEDRPGLYVVGNRDTGELLKYTIPYNHQSLDLPGFEELELPITYDAIIDKLHRVEFSVKAGELLTGNYSESSDQCRYCRFKFLCLKETVEEAQEVDTPTLLEASAMYKDGHALEKQGEAMKTTAKDAFLQHAKANNPKFDPVKFKTSIVSVSYRGMKTKRYADEKKMKEVLDEDTLAKCYSESKPYDDVGIYILKEEQ